MEEGQGRVTKEGSQLRMPAGTSSHHQMAAHTRVQAPWGPGPFPSSEDSGLRRSRHPWAELPESGTHLGVLKRKKKKKGKTKHQRKVQSSGFYKIRVLMELKTCPPLGLASLSFVNLNELYSFVFHVADLGLWQ